MEPILNAQFNQFKKSFAIDCVTADLHDSLKESKAFEYFVNHTLLSADQPDVFVGNFDLLDYISVGGGSDTGIDGLAIKINGRLVGTIDDIDNIIKNNNKIAVEFIFIQSKMQEAIDSKDLTTFCQGVTNFLKEKASLPENEKLKYWRHLKNHLCNTEDIILKWEENPNVKLYYVTASNNGISEHTAGIMSLFRDDFSKTYYKLSDFRIVSGKEIIRVYKDNANSLTVQMTVNDIIPLTTNLQDLVKKAYVFTCCAAEFVKVLQTTEGTLRHSLFYDNVRDYLGNKGVNSEMEETILNEPEMFLLCNNGITIVCSDFELVKDKLVRLENPQIVNGCQTSNSIFKYKDTDFINRVQLIIRVISTDNFRISNKVVRGTNKQNQVLDEAFETTKLFHQNLEEYFLAMEYTPKLYYERRTRQYSNNPLIPKSDIVNLRVITQTFVSMLLGKPHEGHRHEAKLLEMYCGDKREIFDETHDSSSYFICAHVWHAFERAFREKMIPQKYKPYKAHLYYTFICIIGPRWQFNKSKALDKWSEKILKNLEYDNFTQLLPQIIRAFDTAVEEWLSMNKSIHSYKESKEFTTILSKCTGSKHHKIVRNTEKQQESETGTIIFVGTSNHGSYAFVKPDLQGINNNIYFRVKDFSGNRDALIPGMRVSFYIKKDKDTIRAINVCPYQ